MSNDPDLKTLPVGNCWSTKPTSLPGATTKPLEDARADGASSSRGETVAKIGTVVSAIMASSCCWLPPILILMGVSGAGMTAALEEYRPVFMVVTFGFLGTAFYFTYRPRRVAAGVPDCCQSQTGKRRFSMMAMNKAMLWAVTAMAVAFLFFPQVFTNLMVGGNEKITAEMTRTVVKVEGMTCEGWRARAVLAIHQAPGVLAVKVEYPSGLATIGTKRDQPAPLEEIVASLKSIGYRGKLVEEKWWIV